MTLEYLREEKKKLKTIPREFMTDEQKERLHKIETALALTIEKVRKRKNPTDIERILNDYYLQDDHA